MRIILQPGFAFGSAPQQCSAVSRGKGLCWTALLVSALWAWSVPCRAAATSTCSTPSPGDLSVFPDSGDIIADLDGDKRPDLATAMAAGESPKGIRYRIELHLTGQSTASCLSVSAGDGGLRILTRDVDGDGDLDLVINNAWSLAPVGVWINDGHGTFTEGDPAAYLQSIRIEGPDILPDTRAEKLQAALFQSYRSYFDLSLPSHFWNDLTSGRVMLRSTSTPPLRAADHRPSTRAPPAFLLK